MGRTKMSRRVARTDVRTRGESCGVDATRLPRLSDRQGKWLGNGCRQEGAVGRKHRSAGRPPNHARPKGFSAEGLTAVRDQYGGRFGSTTPTLAAEHLAWHDELQADAESHRGDRRWMLVEGQWSRERKQRHRRRCPRKEHFAEIVQRDASVHRRQEERGLEGRLMDLVDDTTGTTVFWKGPDPNGWCLPYVPSLPMRSRLVRTTT